MKSQRNNIYFISDIHLGAPNFEKSRQREDKLVKWLDTIKPNAKELYIVGDLFDFWFEYKTVVPKGYIRLLGKLAEFSDSGIPLHVFIGNHDLWMRDYFQKELNATIYNKPIVKTINNKTFYIGHGDGLGPGDLGYKILKKVFTFKPNKWLFKWFHPDLGIGLADFFSSKSRAKNMKLDENFKEEKEWLIIHAREVLNTLDINYFIFGHRHFPVKYLLNNTSTYFNIGDWLVNFSYIQFDGEECHLRYLNKEES